MRLTPVDARLLEACEERRTIPRDLLLQWHVTQRCNLRCAHCYQESHAGGELGFQDLLLIVDQVKELLKAWKGGAGRRLRVTRVWADRLIPWGSGLQLREQMLTPEETREFFEIMHRGGAPVVLPNRDRDSPRDAVSGGGRHGNMCCTLPKASGAPPLSQEVGQTL